MFKCWDCGKPLEDGFRHKRNYCTECAAKKAANAKRTFDEYWRLKNTMTLERAVSRIEDDDSGGDIEDYREAIEAVREYVEKNPQKLESTEEYITLIVLLSNYVRTICQYQVLNYRADFCLPDMKIILEIDGDRHNKAKDAQRDLEILGEIGQDWTVLRIPTKYVNKYPKQIYDAILDYMIEYKRKAEETPGYILQRVKAIDTAKAAREQAERNKEFVRAVEMRYGCANGYITRPKK